MLRNSRSRYVERNDSNDDIPYSSKLLWSGMFMIEVINHVIMAVLLEMRLFHLRLMLLYRGIILPSVREQYYNRQDSVASYCFPCIFGRCSSFGNCKIKANGANTNDTKRLAI